MLLEDSIRGGMIYSRDPEVTKEQKVAAVNFVVVVVAGTAAADCSFAKGKR
jgi:hypothetical protein